MNRLSNKEVLEQFENFEKNKYSLIISTVSEDGTPLTSYSPFVKLDNDYYVCVSSNLPHYKNMITQQKAHVMIIEDEATANHIYARHRLYFTVECSLEEDSEKIFQLFDERYGDALSFLRGMKDFRVVRFVPQDKSLVLGFGAAYKIDRDGNLQSKSISHN